MTSLDCNDIKAMLSALVDGEVEGTLRHSAERHLAQCASCRALLSDAERLDGLIAREAASLAPATVSDDFMDSVMSRTVYARAYAQAGWNWTGWLGWVAAAASLGLAGSIWFLDRQMPRANTLVSREDPRMHSGEAPGETNRTGELMLRSWTYDEPFAPGALQNVQFASFELDDDTRRAIDDRLAVALPSVRELTAIGLDQRLSDDDQQTLHATANVFEMLNEVDVRSFSDIERVRQIADYDDLPERLANLRPRLQPADRATVLAAESILLRIVNGPLDIEDLRLVHETAEAMGLARAINRIGEDPDRATTSL